MAKTVKIQIIGMKFVPDTVAIVVGDTVEWTNEDAMPHSVVADSGFFASPRLAKTDTYPYQFSTAGSVDYHCGFHPKAMKGKVVVGKGSTQ